jgi:hypothetical protein
MVATAGYWIFGKALDGQAENARPRRLVHCAGALLGMTRKNLRQVGSITDVS